jgi:hypothetical protein
MPGGLLPLVAYGSQNVVVNGNPQMTYFAKAFLRHTHFSSEPIQVPLTGPNSMQMDAPILLTAKMPRSADLIRDMVLRINLPEIYSKVYLDESGNVVRNDPRSAPPYPPNQAPYEFQWVRQIGVRMIQSLIITIGGSKIQEFTDEWIATRALLDQTNTQYAKWSWLVGDVPELFDPAAGVYGDPSGAYPNVVQWTTAPSGQQINAPSIPARELRVPLGLWFSDAISEALPLVALQYHEVEIQLTLRPIRDLYTILDPSGVRLRYGQYSLPYEPTDQYTSIWNPSLYGPLPSSLNNLTGSYSDPSGALRYFLTDFGTTPPATDGWPHNASLETTYIYLTEAERRRVASSPLQYLVRQIQPFYFDSISSRDLYQLDVHNLVSRVVWLLRRNDAIPSRNDWTNLSNWISPIGALRPYVVPTSGQVVPQGIGRSGLYLPGLQRRIMTQARIVGNGNEIFALENEPYFSEYQIWRTQQGGASPYELNGVKTQTSLWPVYAYSFALNGSDALQPSGTINTSRFNTFQLDINVEPIPTGSFYQYQMVIFAETYNFVEFRSGMAGLKYAI